MTIYLSRELTCNRFVTLHYRSRLQGELQFSMFFTTLTFSKKNENVFSFFLIPEDKTILRGTPKFFIFIFHTNYCYYYFLSFPLSPV